MLYLELYHGRDSVDEDMNDWGYDGPIIGPITHITFTYMNIIRIFFKDHKTAVENGFNTVDDNWLEIVDDLILFQGKYYGDFSIDNLTKKEVKDKRSEVKRTQLAYRFKNA